MTVSDKNCSFLKTKILKIVPRLKNHHQRAAAFLQATSGGNDAHHILPDGIRIVRAASLHGGASEQMRDESRYAARGKLHRGYLVFVSILLYLSTYLPFYEIQIAILW